MGWDALGKTLNSFVEDRLVSPLMGTFALSWCFWNYKFLVILFSDADVSTTFALLKSVSFPDLSAVIVNGVVYPLGTTMAYLYLYPFPAAWVLEQWKKTQLKLTTIRRKYDDEAPASQADLRAERLSRYSAEEEAQKLRDTIAQLRRDYNDALRAAADTHSSSASEPPLPSSSKAGGTKTTNTKKATSKRAPAKAGVGGVSTSSAFTEGYESDVFPSSAPTHLALTSPEVMTMNLIRDRGGQVDNGQLLDALVEEGLQNEIHAQYVVQQLIDRDLLDFDPMSEVTELTQRGRSYFYGSAA